MRLLKNLSLATRLYALVAVVLLIAAGLSVHAMQQVKGTEGVLKYTIDNRMVSAQTLQDISDALLVARDASRSVVDKTLAPDAAHEQIASRVGKAREDWDKYFLADMIKEEQALADETTPLLDKTYAAIDKLQAKLKSGDLAGLEEFRTKELRPAIAAANDNLKQLSGMQILAAKRDQDRARERSAAAMKQGFLLLGAGLVLAVVLAWLIVRSVMKRLGADPAEAARVASRIADGDYQFQLRGGAAEGSLLSALTRMKDSLLHSKLDYEGQLTAISKVQAVVEFTPEGIVTNANENFLKATGYSLDDVKGKHHSQFVDVADRERPQYRELWPALGRGEPQGGVYRRIARDGRELWLQGVYNPIVGADGKPFKVVKYATDVTQQRNAEQLNAAFKGALEKLSANVLVADNEFKVIYANEAVRTALQTAESDLRRDLPNFEARKLVGMSVDQLYKDPQHQRTLLTGLTSTHTMESSIGGHMMKIVSNPMKDDGGRRLGTVFEWFDRTQEMATESELQGVISGVMDGELTRRIDLGGKTGFFETLSRGINDLVENVSTVVTEVQDLVAAANTGDLTRRMQTEGKAGLLVAIGTGINQLTDNMASVVAQVKAASQEVSRGADEISQGNTNLSQRTEEQASSLEETASSMEEMTSTVKQNADNAGQANQLAVAARDQAEKGGAVVAKAVKAMSEINEASKKIADIIGVIDEIAFQTNLLALNAAVEAARAGEQGRGFAVVASEVRNLAGRSATAAKEIKALIQDSVKKVDEGSSLVTQSGATLDQIVAAVKKVTDIVAEIAAASHEQSSGIEQVNKAVMQLDELTQQNAALVEQASAASQAMAEQARGLNERMSAYRVDGGQFAELETEPAKVSSAPAPAKAVERRKGSRPWKKAAAKAASTDGVRPPPTSTGTGDEVWQEF
jgi:methyl-accepting chemotaxis protein